MDKKLKQIIGQSTFTVIKGTYAYAKVSKVPISGKHFMISTDKDEITVVTDVHNLRYLNMLERNKEDYSLIALNISIPFYSVGLLATVSDSIAKENMNILIISTYSKDYIMIKKKHMDKATAVLESLGFKSS